METSKLRKFASFARKSLIEQVGTKLKTVLAEGSLARRENSAAVRQLEKKIAEIGKQQTIETVAYTWFNRFCALRYMDVNRYTKIGILSPAEGQFLPEILGEAKAGHVDDEIVPAATREKVLRILDGTDPSDDPQGEAYRLLLVAACNHYHSLMPFLFERIADYTELLLPDDLLSGSAIPTYTREALLPANCCADALPTRSSRPSQGEGKADITLPLGGSSAARGGSSTDSHTGESVEVIGWLYQFYIAEKKDDVFAALKKGRKITPENIPAATQLFTPHWIVRYLVENSLGRLWMLNHPDSKLVERMDYYIASVSDKALAVGSDADEQNPRLAPSGSQAEPETAFLKIASPEELKVCDPACGSGHMLTYAFDLLYAIYEEQGYQPTEIPTLILTHNLYGIEIDDRAGALAAFALQMKAREKYRRFLSPGKIVQPNICVLENIKFDPEELNDYMDQVGRDLFTGGLEETLNQWEEADNFGSLIRPLVTGVSEVLKLLRERKMDEDLFLMDTHQKVLKALLQADYLSPKYHVVVANPPYMGSKGMRKELKDFANTSFPDAKSDLFAMFTQRMAHMVEANGFMGLMTPFTWMFIRSYQQFRNWMLDQFSLTSLVRPEYHAFFDSAFVPICAFSARKGDGTGMATFIDLNDFYGEEEQPTKTLEAIANPDCGWAYQADTDQFRNIPGSPFAYQLTEAQLDVFRNCETLSNYADVKEGLNTGDNERFFRHWAEVSQDAIKFDASSAKDAQESKMQWFPCNKGGSFRRWYGNNEYVLDWKGDGYNIRNFRNEDGKVLSAVRNSQFYFKTGLTWSGVGSSGFSVRHFGQGFVFNSVGRSLFPKRWHWYVLGYLNSSVSSHFLKVLAPTLHFSVGDIANLPMREPSDTEVSEANAIVQTLVDLSTNDWNLQEISWEFQTQPLIDGNRRLEASIREHRDESELRFNESRKLMERLNQQYVTEYRLDGEIDSSVPDAAVSLRQLSDDDIANELISYAVGCMFGRYSLDKPGLILANQSDTLREYFRLTISDFGLKGEYDDSRLNECLQACTFAPDDDNVIPMLDGDWFTDDISERFKEFLKITFGTEHYAENLQFLEDAIYPDNATARKRKTIRDYFLKDFYNHHVKLYKKRPIYWLFSSPKGTFNALIYMHCYRSDTVSSVLQYLRDFRDKLAHRRDHGQMVADSGGSTAAEKTKALKEVTATSKQLKELEDYERDTLFPLAQQKREIDLDDGVKHNYPLFGTALKKVTGLSK